MSLGWGRGTVWKSEGEWGDEGRRGVGGIYFILYISGFWPPPWLTELPLVGGRSTQLWSGERKTSACTVFCRQGADRPLGELSMLVLWEGL